MFEGGKESTVAEHSIHVTTISLFIGLGMGYDKKRLLPLAMLAFLHDVGMHKIPQDIVMTLAEIAHLSRFMPEARKDQQKKKKNKLPLV